MNQQPTTRDNSTAKRRRAQTGFSVVEIMVAMTVGLILLLGITQLLLAGKKSFRLQNSTGVMQENGRYAMNFLTTSLRAADHWGGVEAGDVSGAPSVTPRGSCNAAWILDVDNGIQGYQGAATLPAALNNCIPAANYQPNSDLFVVRYAQADKPFQTTGTGDDSLEHTDNANKVFVRTAVGERAELITGASGPSSLPAAGEQAGTYNFPYRVNLFFIRPCSVQGPSGNCSDATNSIPTLVRLHLAGNSLVQEPLVEGIESIKLEYGLDTTSNGRPDQFRTANNIAAAQWPAVASVRLNLVVRSLDRDPDLNDQTTYVLLPGPNASNHAVPAGSEAFTRKIMSSVVQIRNRTRG